MGMVGLGGLPPRLTDDLIRIVVRIGGRFRQRLQAQSGDQEDHIGHGQHQHRGGDPAQDARPRWITQRSGDRSASHKYGEADKAHRQGEYENLE